MTLHIGDHVRLVDAPTQTGIIIRDKVFSMYGLVVDWSAGPVYPSGKNNMAYIGLKLRSIELVE